MLALAPPVKSSGFRGDCGPSDVLSARTEDKWPCRNVLHWRDRQPPVGADRQESVGVDKQPPLAVCEGERSRRQTLQSSLPTATTARPREEGEGEWRR